MQFLLKILIRAAIVIVLAMFLLNKRNSLCIEKGNCRPIYAASEFRNFKKFLSRFGDKNKNSSMTANKVNFFTISSENDVEIRSDKDYGIVEFDKAFILKLTITNHRENDAIIKPLFNTDPRSLIEFVTLHQCLCSKKIRLKPHESRVIKIVFEIDSNIINTTKEELKFVYSL